MIRIILLLFILIVLNSYGNDIEIVEAQESNLVNNFETACIFAEKYPRSKYGDEIITRVYQSLDILELKKIHDYYPESTLLRSEIDRLVLLIIPKLNLKELLEMKLIFTSYKSCKKIDEKIKILKKREKKKIREVLSRYKQSERSIGEEIIYKEIEEEFDIYFQNGIDNYLEDVYSLKNKLNTLRNKVAFWDNIKEFKEAEKMRLMWSENFDGERLNTEIEAIVEYVNKERLINRNRMILELIKIIDFEITEIDETAENNRRNYDGTVITNVNNSALNQELCSMGLSGAFAGFMAWTIPTSGPFAPITTIVEVAVEIGIDIVTTKKSKQNAKEKLTAAFDYNKNEYLNQCISEYNEGLEKDYKEIEKELIKKLIEGGN